VEIVFLQEMKDKVIQKLRQLDLDTFSPAQAVETISPKSRYGFRIVHQPLLLEALLYTASVVEIADDLKNSSYRWMNLVLLAIDLHLMEMDRFSARIGLTATG
jgi:hypothetical protein